MFESYEISYYIYFVVVGIALYYLYKAIKQLKTRDVDFYSKDRYTEESVEKWAVTDGWLKVCAALVFAVYGILGLLEINIIFITIGLLVAILVVYFILYSKVLVRKEDF